jgi:hypothetical protein
MTAFGRLLPFARGTNGSNEAVSGMKSSQVKSTRKMANTKKSVRRYPAKYC